MTSEEKQPLFGGTSEQGQVFPTENGFPVANQQNDVGNFETFNNPKTKYLVLGYTFAVSICVLITIILSIIRAHQAGAVYLLLGISILCIGFVELGLIYLYRKDDIPRDRMWFVLFVGFCIFIEAVLTNVILYAK